MSIGPRTLAGGVWESYTLRHLAVGVGGKFIETQIAGLVIYHICGVDGINWYFGTCDGKGYRVRGDASLHTQHGDIHIRAFRAAQPLHDIVVFHLHSGDGSVVDGDYAVAGQHAYPLRRTAADRLYDIERVAVHVEGDADAAEVALQGLVNLLGLFGRRV